MTNKSVIVDSRTKEAGRVTQFGQVVTAPISYDDISAVNMTVDNLPYNFIIPKANNDIIITGILIASTRDVGTNGTVLTMYTSDAADSTTIINPFIEADLARQQSRDILPLNLNLGQGVWINGFVTDAVVNVSLLYYYLQR